MDTNQKRINKNQKGITLIALTVTVIVLLILASISIATLTGEKGIINQSKLSKEAAKITEEMKVVNLAAIDAINNHRYGYLLTEDQFAEELNKYIGIRGTDYNVVLLENLELFKVTYLNSGRSYLVEKDGEVIMEGDIETEENPLVTFSYDPNTLTNGNVTVSIACTDNKYVIEYRTEKTGQNDETETGKWNVYNPNRKVILERNEKIYVALVDNQKAERIEVSTTGLVDKIDKLAPNDFEPEVKETKSNKITIKAKTNDAVSKSENGQTPDYATSGILGYRFSLNNKDWSDIVNDGEYTFEKLKHNTEYTLYVKAIDNVGNETLEKITSKTDKVPDLILGENIIFNQYPEGWTNQNVKVTAEIIDEELKELIENSEFILETSKDEVNWTTTNPLTFEENGTMYARLTAGTDSGGSAKHDVTNIDKIKPVVTAKSATTNSITFTATDNASGIVGWAINTEGIAPTEFTTVDNTMTLDITKTGLKQKTTHYIWLKDEAGNISIAEEIITETVPKLEKDVNVKFTQVPTNWTNGNVTVTAELIGQLKDSSFILQTSKDREHWDTTNPQVFDLNGTMYARLSDGLNVGEPASHDVTNIDKVKPIVTAINLTTNSVEITATDDASGIVGWIVTTTNSTPDKFNTVENTMELNVTQDKLKQDTTYFIWIKDEAGNISVAKEVKTEKVPDLIKDVNVRFNQYPEGWTNGNVTVIAELIGDLKDSNYILQTQKNGANFTTTNTQEFEENGTIYARITDTNGQAGEPASHDVTNIDKVKPIITETIPTTNSIEITATDDASGIIGWTVTENATVPTEFTSVENTMSLNVTKTGLLQEKTYYIWVKDEAGNVNVAKPTKTEKVPDLVKDVNVTFEQDPTKWTNGNVIVTAKIITELQNAGFTLQTSKDNKNWGTTNPQTFEANGTMYARLSDGINVGGSANHDVTNIDKIKPIVTTATATTNRIQITATDEASGIIGWTVTTTDSEPTAFTTLTESTRELSVAKTGLNQKTQYYVWVKDKAGNVSLAKPVKTETVPGLVTNSNITFKSVPEDWTNKSVTVTATPVTTLSSYTLETSKDGKTYNTTNPQTYTENGVMYARLKDSTGQVGTSASYNVTNIDTVKPIVKTATPLTESIQIEATDEASGIIGYAVTESSTEPTSFTEVTRTMEFSINKTGLKDNTQYYVWVKDKAGNVSVAKEAKTQRKAFTVTYDYSTNGGTSATKTSATVNYGTAIDLTPTATKSGYTFVGWNTSSTATEKLNSLTMGESNVTLYAIFSKTIIGTFKYYNNATSTVSETIYNNTTKATIKAPAIANTTVSGTTYTGRGWSTATGSSATINVASGANVELTANATYYASYSAEITATFYYHSGTDQTKNTQTSTTAKGTRYMTYTGAITQSNIAIPATVTGSTGYYGTSYAGVSTSTSNTTSTTPTTATTKYYAYYNGTVTMYYYDGSNHTSSPVTKTATTGGSSYSVTSTTVPTPKAYSNTNFIGWSTSPTSVNSTTVTTTTVNTLYAYYQKTVWLYYGLNGGTNAPSTQSGIVRHISKSGGINTYNASITISSLEPTKTGNTFQGWGDSTTDSAKYAKGSIITIDANKTIYAIWKGNTYTVVYNANGGSGTMDNTTHTYGIASNLRTNTFTKSGGYSFDSWNTEANGTGTKYTDGQSVTNLATSGTITLYAQWAENMLMSTSLAKSTSNFLRTNLARENIESIKISNSIEGHSVTDSNCWDVSNKSNKSVLAWSDDKDNDGYYEITIGANEKVFSNPSSEGLFCYIGYKGDDAQVLYDLNKLDVSKVTNASYMFYYCGYLSMTNLTISNEFDTSNVTNMYSMFANCGFKSMTSFTIGFDTSKVNNMSQMFKNLGVAAMISLNLGNNFNTSNVVNMSEMFYNCGSNKMTNLNLGDTFDTSNVSNMSSMFEYCGNTEMQNLTLGNKFNTSNVINMKSMFASCGEDKMTTLNLGTNFDTSNVTNMRFMFQQCGYSAMTSLDLGNNFNTSNVTDMYSMFASCGRSKMTTLKLGNNFDTSNVTTMQSMFSYCGYGAMTSLNLGDKFDTSNVTEMRDMFRGCGYTAMTTLNLGTNFNTSNVTNMYQMFNNCGYTKMTSLNLGDKFNTSQVTNMGNMFDSCGYKALNSLNLGANFDTSNVTSTAGMFYRCGHNVMTSLDLGDKFNMQNAISIDSMFTACGEMQMTKLDISSMSFDNVQTYQNIFQYCGKTTCTVYVKDSAAKTWVENNKRTGWSNSKIVVGSM